MKLIGTIVLWLLTAFFILAAIMELPSAAAFALLLAAALIIPISPWQKLLREKLKLRGWMKGVAAAILFIVGLSVIGSEATSATTPNLPDQSVVATTGQPDTTVSLEETKSPEETTPASTSPAPVPSPTSEPSPSPEPTEKPEEQSTQEDSTFSIHFIDVGQADAALVECDGEYMLIDGGNKADSNVIYSVLKKASASHLKLVVGTHGHEDHIGGLPGAFSYATADTTLCSVTSYDSSAFEDFAKYADEKGGGITVPSVGDTYTLGSATLTILGVNGGSDTNDTSIVLKIQYGETSFLFTGDAEREAEQAILDSGADLSATVLKVGHHGSDTSTSYVFLREIMPQYAVISVGEGNSYGHPTEDTLSRLRDADIKVYRTDLQGDIYCTSDGKAVSFSVDYNANADTLSPVVTVTPSPSATPAPAPEPETEPAQQYNTIDELKEIVSVSCDNYNNRKIQLLQGILTFNVISTTEVELQYEVSASVYPDTEYLVDEVMDQILDHVIDDLDESNLPEVVTVGITANYYLSEEEPEPSVSIGTTYVLNTDSKKFHYPSCYSAARIADHNKAYFTGTRAEIIAKGYSPCGNCDP